MANLTSTSPLCQSGTINLNCITSVSTLDNTQFNLTFIPVCPKGCIANQTMNFTITNIKNPSYINTQANPITIQTTNQYFTGIIDVNYAYIQGMSLTAFISNVSSIQIIGSSIVGSQMNLTMNFSISSYYQYNDGQIVLNLPMNSTFIYSTLNAFVLVNNQQIPINMTYSLYDNNMMSISSITITQACTLTTCGSSLTIKITGLAYSYSAVNYSPYNFTIYTVGG
jgi:hypothetical protein